MAKHIKKFTCAGLEEYLSELKNLLAMPDRERDGRLAELIVSLGKDLQRMKLYAEFYKSRRELADTQN